MISPVIFTLGPVELRWYGVMTALGGLLGYALMKLRSRKYSINDDHLGTVIMITLFSALIGARLFYVLRFWNESFANRPFSSVFKIWEGGLVFQGGFIVTAVALIVYCLWTKLSLASLGDLMAPALPLGHAAGRIGCFINGCCFGYLPYDGPLAVRYSFSPDGHFPVQLVESAGNLLICGLLLLLERRRIATGKLFLIYLFCYTVLRCCVEPLRGDYPADQVWMHMTPGQYHALWQLPLIIIAFAAVSIWNRHKKQAGKSEKKA